jgi:hydrogenase maturation protein HypF
VLVMTSANLSEEPIAYRDEDARQRLAGWQMASCCTTGPSTCAWTTRWRAWPAGAALPAAPRARLRARPLPLPAVPPLLAAGAELKNTFCLARDRYAFLSHHIGDLENYETLRSFEEGIQHYQRLFRVQPRDASPVTCTPITWRRATPSSAPRKKTCRWWGAAPPRPPGGLPGR